MHVPISMLHISGASLRKYQRECGAEHWPGSGLGWSSHSTAAEKMMMTRPNKQIAFANDNAGELAEAKHLLMERLLQNKSLRPSPKFRRFVLLLFSVLRSSPVAKTSASGFEKPFRAEFVKAAEGKICSSAINVVDLFQRAIPIILKEMAKTPAFLQMMIDKTTRVVSWRHSSL